MAPPTSEPATSPTPSAPVPATNGVETLQLPSPTARKSETTTCPVAQNRSPATFRPGNGASTSSTWPRSALSAIKPAR
ncbi:hypothetical protein [Amycolatopsis rubida]|uniref:hypothetical protein n=1 Tax=Amycolatopsis rubida TaxID=112413 RepID=UPI003B8A7C5D